MERIAVDVHAKAVQEIVSLGAKRDAPSLPNLHIVLMDLAHFKNGSDEIADTIHARMAGDCVGAKVAYPESVADDAVGNLVVVLNYFTTGVRLPDISEFDWCNATDVPVGRQEIDCFRQREGRLGGGGR